MPFGSQRGRGRSQRSGIPIRLIIAVGIALFSIISYFSMGAANPITHETQRVALTPKQEIAMGLAAVPEMTQQYGGLSPDRSAQQELDRIGNELLGAVLRIVQENDGTNPFQFEFYLLKDGQTVNAFALPGGQVFVTEGLYKKLQTEGQLAGVVGHEIGHVLMRHGAQRLASQKLTQGLVGAAGMAGGSAQSAQMAAAVGQMVNMKYGRDDELEADKWGVKLTAEAGYDPRSMLDLMDILDKAGGGGGQPEIMSTHPKPANRKAYIKEVIESVYPNGLPQGLKK